MGETDNSVKESLSRLLLLRYGNKNKIINIPSDLALLMLTLHHHNSIYMKELITLIAQAAFSNVLVV